LHNLKWVERSNGDLVAVSRSGALSIADEHGREREWYKLPYGALISVKEGAKVDAGTVVATWDPHTHPIIADRAGVVRYQAFEDGITVKRQVDELTGLANYEIIDEKDRPAAGKDLKPGIFLYAEGAAATDEPVAHFSLPGSALVSLEDGTNIEGGSVVARIPQESTKTRDITGGLPRVADLFEARKPKESSILAEMVTVMIRPCYFPCSTPFLFAQGDCNRSRRKGCEEQRALRTTANASGERSSISSEP